MSLERSGMGPVTKESAGTDSFGLGVYGGAGQEGLAAPPAETSPGPS